MRFSSATSRSAYLFPSSSSSSPCPKDAWVAYLRHHLQALGFPADQFSGHSFRSGGATDLWDSGERPRHIQRYGRWLSDAFWLYIRDNPELTAQQIAAAFRRLAAWQTSQA